MKVFFALFYCIHSNFIYSFKAMAGECKGTYVCKYEWQFVIIAIRNHRQICTFFKAIYLKCVWNKQIAIDFYEF